MKSSRNPALYLAGWATAEWKDDVILAQQINWKQGLPNPFTGDNLKTYYWDSFVSAIPEAAAITWKDAT